MVDIDFNPNEFSIPAETDVTINLPAGDEYYSCSIAGHEAAGMFGTVHVA